MLSLFSRCTLNVGVVSRLGSVHLKSYSTNRMTTEQLNKVPDVEIESEGVFKYILIKVYAKETADGKEPSKLIVRGGNEYGPYHGDIYDATTAILVKLGLDSECLGGGRINHDPTAKKITVYGYSQGFGKADHELAVALLKKKYSGYNITWSNEGY